MSDNVCIPLDGFSEDDILDIHGRLASALRAIGLSGHPLDEAVSACFQETVRIVKRERQVDAKRRSGISLLRTQSRIAP